MTDVEPPIVHTITLGCIQARVHHDESSDSIEYTVTVARLDTESAESVNARTLGPTNIPLLTTVLNQAYAWIAEHRASRKGE